LASAIERGSIRTGFCFFALPAFLKDFIFTSRLMAGTNRDGPHQSNNRCGDPMSGFKLYTNARLFQ
jgi:hypothetical protein